MSRRPVSTSPSYVDRHTERLISGTQGIATEKENGAYEKYRLLFDGTRNIVFFIRLDGSIAEVNKAAADAHGYSKKELESMNIADLCIDDTREKLPGLLEKCYTHGCIYETAHRRKDGSSFPLEINSMGFSLHGEKAIISIGRDITERKRNEEALKLAQFSIEKSADGVFWITPEGMIFYANDAVCKRLQYTRDELRKMSVWDIDPIYTREVWAEHWQDITSRGSSTFETIHRAKDGRTYPVEVSANYVKFGDREYDFVFTRDITERKRLEEALKDREEKLRSRLSAILSPGDVGEKTISEVVDIPALQDLADSFYAITGATISILGLKGDILVSAGWQDICTKFHRCHPETLKNCRECDVHLFGAVAEGEHSMYKCKNGLWDVVTPIVLNGRSMAYIFAGQFFFDDEQLDYDRFVRQAEKYGFDKEEYLAALERIPRYSREKVQKVMEFYTKFAMMVSRLSYSNVQLARSLAEQKRAEKEMVEAKKQAELYLDLMGHDISNMNQIAMGYLELAGDMIEDEGTKELLDKPLDAIQNSSKLIENVRKLQKLKSGGIKKEAINLDTVLVKLRDQYSNLPGKEVIIDYVPCHDCYVMANELLTDMFSNLIGNAIKHSGPLKSVRIGLRLERIDEAGRAYCKATVEDDGPGIPDMLKKKVFARFQNGNVKASGTGLGLYLVKTLVEDFHGSVRVEDRVPGDHTKGARFVVTLPMVEKCLTY